MDIKEIKTKDIADNPENPRKKLGDITSLVRSIEALGLQQPISVRSVSKTKFVVVAGARRLAAVKKLGYDTVTCVVRSHEETTQLASIAENTAREDLSVDELADALVRLDGLEVTDKEIADALAIQESSVPAARVIAKATKKSRARLIEAAPETRQFTLEESAALLAYVDERGRFEQLTDTVEYDPERLPHVIARFEAEDALKAKIAELRSSMKGAIEIPPFVAEYGKRPPKGAEPLHNLTTGDGKTLTAANHKDCKFRAFMVLGTFPFVHEAPKIVHYCSDWESAGHKMSPTPKQVWRQESEAAKPRTDADTQERRRVIANNKAWVPASKVRATWIEEFTERKELNAAAKLWVLTELMLNPTLVGPAHFYKGTLSGPQALEKAFVIVWRQLVQAREGELARCTWRPGGFVKKTIESYVQMLAAQGYPLSEVESILVPKKAVADAA